MLVSTKGRYALKVMIDLAEHYGQGYISLQDIANMVRAWAKAEDWGNVYYYLLEYGKRALDEAGIKVPYQQMDVHLQKD